MKATIITLLFAASIAGASGREHNLLVDLARPRTLRLTCASATDSTITADVKKNGSDFDASGWTGLFWIGDDRRRRYADKRDLPLRTNDVGLYIRKCTDQRAL